MKINVRSALLCDDVRVEANGKHILIGVYAGDILVTGLPATLSLIVWLEIAPGRNADQLAFEYKVTLPGRAKERRGNINMMLDGEEHAFLIMRLSPFELTQEGRLTLALRAPGDRWAEVFVKRIRLAPDHDKP